MFNFANTHSISAFQKKKKTEIFDFGEQKHPADSENKGEPPSHETVKSTKLKDKAFKRLYSD